ncbi:glycosyltransferase family 2 protein [Opitutus sp. ER46]|uniref:glycosyltransferase family 2 protein n=1 Tax=Opitutus sp. ER46 TaxID=2161864 RepID=UPI000D31FDA0|nr:glycosyltransferase family 2 protein [Opitutus sp. ER46]PTX95546.1 glycosyltransferase [Opitutus sp. ER46]
MADPLPTVAIVIPVFNEEPVLPELLRRLDAVMTGTPGATWRAVFVNDGSRDRSVTLLKAAAAGDARLTVVELSRNFGHQPALAAGIAEAGDADAVVTMDADLQDPPELIPELLARWQGGADVVLAVRRSRQEHGVRRLGFDLFHRMFQRLSDLPVPRNTGTFGLLGRAALGAYNRLPERHRFFPGLRAWVGFETAEVLYDRQDRAAGKPTQTFAGLMRYALDAIFSFSRLPLRLLTYAGIFISSCGFALGLFFVCKRLLGIETASTGFTTLVTLTLFLGGIQLIGIGILGEYLGRIYDEVKQRPLYVVKPRSPARSRHEP